MSHDPHAISKAVQYANSEPYSGPIVSQAWAERFLSALPPCEVEKDTRLEDMSCVQMLELVEDHNRKDLLRGLAYIGIWTGGLTTVLAAIKLAYLHLSPPSASTFAVLGLLLVAASCIALAFLRRP